MRASIETCKKYLSLIIFLYIKCFTVAQVEDTPIVGLYPMDTPVYKEKDAGLIHEWVEGNVSEFHPSSNTYSILWSDMTTETIGAETLADYVNNELLFEESKLVQDVEQEVLMQEQYEEEELISGVEDTYTSDMDGDEEDEGDNASDREPVYAIGTTVAVTTDDGTKRYGTIESYSGGYYTVQWESDGISEIFAVADGEIDDMVVETELPLVSMDGNTSKSGLIAGITGAVVLVTVAVAAVAIVHFRKNQRLENQSLLKRNDDSNILGRTRLSLEFDGNGKNLLVGL